MQWGKETSSMHISSAWTPSRYVHIKLQNCLATIAIAGSLHTWGLFVWLGKTDWLQHHQSMTDDALPQPEDYKWIPFPISSDKTRSWHSSWQHQEKPLIVDPDLLSCSLSQPKDKSIPLHKKNHFKAITRWRNILIEHISKFKSLFPIAF